MTRPSIRDRLESDAWSRYPEHSRRIAAHRSTRPRYEKEDPADRVLLIIAALLVLFLIVRMETAYGSEDPFWGIEFSGGDHAAQTVALDTAIEAEVTGLVARVEITQRFRNGDNAWAEAVYRYPLPEGAAVDRLIVEVGGRVLEGEIREKEQARREYGKAVAEGKVASLVEQQRANLFETRLANIAPGEEILITIGFLANIDFRDGAFSLKIPMTATPRWEPGAPASAPEQHFTEAGHSNGHRLALEVMLKTAAPLSRLESRYHDVEIQTGADGYRILLNDPGARTDRVFELSWSPEFTADTGASLMTWDGGDAVYALLMLTPPLEDAIEPSHREVVFIIDTSGSMQGEPLTQAVAALAQGLELLQPDDRFNLVEFNSGFHALFDESVPAMPWRLEQAVEFLEGLEADGGTNMAPALDFAMGLPAWPKLLRQIVFITDGSVGNEGELLLGIGEKLGESRLFTVSIGGAPNEWFMRKAAAVGRGIHTHIGRLADVESRMAALWTRIQTPAVQNLDVDWGMQADSYPEVIPDLYAGEPLWLTARLPLEPREVTVSGEIGGRPWESGTMTSAIEGGEGIGALWARSRIESLEDSRIFGVDAETVRSEVIDTALAFGLISRYTSLVAVDRTPSRPQSEALETADVPSLLPAGSRFAAGFSQTATGWPAQVALSLLSLLVVFAMLLHTPPKRTRRGQSEKNPGGAES